MRLAALFSNFATGGKAVKNFLRTTKAKVLIGVLVAVAGVMTYLGASGQLSSIGQELFAAAAVPFQRLTAGFSGSLEAAVKKYVSIDEVISENDALKEENAKLRDEVVELDTLRAQNEQYRAALQIQEKYPTYDTVSASVIGRDPAEKYYSFTIDQGSLNGIKVKDPVISASGAVVGRVAEVGPNYAKVLTILDPTVNISCIVSRTRDNGLLAGDTSLSAQGLCTLTLLPRETMAAQQDFVVTTGMGGLFPSGLMVGSVREVRPEASGNSMYAVVEPAEDITAVRMVFVITHYEA